MLHQEYVKGLIPLRDAIEILSGKWKIPIVLTLLIENKRYKELNIIIKGISSKVLSSELQNLEENRIINKVTDPENGIVRYAITSHGETLKPLIDDIEKWGLLHRKVILGR